MSAHGKTDLAQDWRLALRIREEEADRLAQMSDQDFERAMAKLPEPSHVPTVEELLARGEREARPGPSGPGGRVQAVDMPEEHRGVSPFVWLLAAAFAAVLAAGIAKREAVIAFFKGPPAPQHEPEPSLAQRAELARVDAKKACDREQWDACGAKLDEAQNLDPAGELQPAVQEMRKSIDAHQWKRVDPTREEKPQRR